MPAQPDELLTYAINEGTEIYQVFRRSTFLYVKER